MDNIPCFSPKYREVFGYRRIPTLSDFNVLNGLAVKLPTMALDTQVRAPAVSI